MIPRTERALKVGEKLHLRGRSVDLGRIWLGSVKYNVASNHLQNNVSSLCRQLICSYTMLCQLVDIAFTQALSILLDSRNNKGLSPSLAISSSSPAASVPALLISRRSGDCKWMLNAFCTCRYTAGSSPGGKAAAALSLAKLLTLPQSETEFGMQYD